MYQVERKEEKSRYKYIVATVFLIVGIIFTILFIRPRSTLVKPLDYTSQRDGLLNLLNLHIKDSSIIPDEQADKLITFNYDNDTFTLVGNNDNYVYVLSIDTSDMEDINTSFKAFNYLSTLEDIDMTSSLSRIDISDDDPYTLNHIIKDNKHQYICGNDKCYLTMVKGNVITYIVGELNVEIIKSEYKAPTVNGRKDLDLFSAYYSLLVD